jgi:hypothetical protein
MLAYVLAIAIGLISTIFFLAAFFAPKVHRQDDFLWSGVGLFYALVLWVCAEQMTGAILLGQTAATLLLLAYGAETINLRGAIANPDKIPAMKSFSVTKWLLGVGGLFAFLSKPKVQLETPKPEATIAEEKAETTEELKQELAEETTGEATEAEVDKSSPETETEVESPESSPVNEEIAITQTDATIVEEERETVTEAASEQESAKTVAETPANVPAQTAKKENLLSGWLGKITSSFSKNKTKTTGLSAAPILEADEDVEDFEPEVAKRSPEVETTTNQTITETVSTEPTEPEVKSEVILETSPQVVEKIESPITENAEVNPEQDAIEPEVEVKADETTATETQAIDSPETPPETTELVTAQETPQIVESEISPPESIASIPLQEEIETTSSPENSQPNPAETIEKKEEEKIQDTTSDLKAEIAKIFEEEEGDKK